jgi:transcriptional regulator with XRE-family HTH domain
MTDLCFVAGNEKYNLSTLDRNQVMPRSRRVAKNFTSQVKVAVHRHGYPRQRDLAEELNLCLSTISNFLNGKPVDNCNFLEICNKLAQDPEAIADSEFDSDDNSANVPKNLSCQEAIAPAFLEQLEAEDFIYVKRPPTEALCERTLLQPGALVRIKAPGLMGKTSLMAKVLPQLGQKGFRTAYLNLHYAQTADFTDLDKFLKWFCISVGQSLGMPNRIADYWDEQFSTPKMNCKTYFEKYLLPKADTPLLLWLDEVERVFPHLEVATDFLGLLRAWHEEAKIRNIWKRLRLVVSHSTEVYVQLKINESPFNVGLPIELPEFNPQQVQNLAQCQGLAWDLTQVKQLMSVVGGHPYLVQLAFSEFKLNQGATLEQVLPTAATEAGIYGNYLRRLWCIIQQHSELVAALKKVVTAITSVRLEPMQAYKLQGMGLVHLVGNEVTISCNLYRQYFCDRFGVS